MFSDSPVPGGLAFDYCLFQKNTENFYCLSVSHNHIFVLVSFSPDLSGRSLIFNIPDLYQLLNAFHILSNDIKLQINDVSLFQGFKISMFVSIGNNRYAKFMQL